MPKKHLSLITLALTSATLSSSASAYFVIYSPKVEYGETELEVYGHYINDSDTAINGGQQYVLEAGKGFTPKLFVEAKLEAEQENKDAPLSTSSIAVEGVYKLTEQGEYSWDVGLLGEIEYSTVDDKLAAVAFGPVASIDFGSNMTFTANLIAERKRIDEITETSANAQLKWRLNPEFEPGVEIYNEYADGESAHYVGPMVMGKIRTDSAKIGYQVGWLVGMNDTSADNTFKFKVEYEF